MYIYENVSLENISMNLKGNSKNEILEEMIKLLSKDNIKDEEKLIKDIIKRESSGSTALEYGLAIPHVRSEHIEKFEIAIGLKPDGIDFDSIDGKETRLFFLVATPLDDRTSHLEALAKIASILYNPININVLATCKSKEGLVDLISKLEGK